MTQSLLIKGSFNEADLRQLTETIRYIERRSPEQTFMLVILNDDLSVADAEAIAKRIFPRIEGNEPTFYTMQAMDVMCPDGQTRKMTPDIPHTLPDLDQAKAIMLRGTVTINNKIVRGAAWLRNGTFYFETD